MTFFLEILTDSHSVNLEIASEIFREIRWENFQRLSSEISPWIPVEDIAGISP